MNGNQVNHRRFLYPECWFPLRRNNGFLTREYSFSGCKKKVSIGEVLLEYMTYIPQQKYEEMYKMIDVKSSGSIERDKFIERNSKIYEGIEISNFEVDVLEVDEKELTVTYKTSFDTLSDKVTFENTANFVESEEGYKMIWKDSLIVPNLESTDKVQVSVNKAIRGKILDRNEYVLAGQGEAFAVGLVPQKIEDDENTFARLSGILGVDVDTIRKKLDASWVRADLFVPLKMLSTEHVYSDRVNPSARTNCTTFTKKQNRFHGRCASPISFILQIFLFQSVN